MRVQYASLPQPTTQYADESGYLFIVADGMGGHQAGEQASALAVQTLEAFALNTLKWFFRLKVADEQDILKEFQTALQQADARVCWEAAQHPSLRAWAPPSRWPTPSVPGCSWSMSATVVATCFGEASCIA